jgi:hypothetical protein
MSISDLPEGTADDASLSFNESVDAIENLFDGSAKNPEEKVEATNEAEDEADEPEVGEAETDEAAPDEEEVADEEEPGPDPAAGRFVSGDAKFKLSDGTVISVADLARNNLYQQDYTRKTQEHSEVVRDFEAKREKVGEIAQALVQQRDFLLSAAQQFLPQPPDRAMLDPNSQKYDPIGFTHAKAEYDDRMAVVTQLHQQRQAEQGRMTQEQQEEQKQYRAREAEKLFEAIPEFRDRKVYGQFWNDAVEVMADYGFSQEELDAAGDHRFYRVMRDVVKYRKALKAAPQVKQDIQSKPALIKGGKRMDPKAKISRDVQTRRERLRSTGSFEASVAALMDLDL